MQIRNVETWAYDDGWIAKLDCGHVRLVSQTVALRTQKKDAIDAQLRCPECELDQNSKAVAGGNAHG